MELKEGERQLKYLNFPDLQTGLYDRSYFEEELSRHRTLGLILTDFGGLKLINCILGHKTGNGLLLGMTDIIKDCCLFGELVARIGVGEFTVILPDGSRAVIEGICERYREITQQYNQRNPKLPLSLSVGYSIRAMGKTTSPISSARPMVICIGRR